MLTNREGFNEKNTCAYAVFLLFCSAALVGLRGHPTASISDADDTHARHTTQEPLDFRKGVKVKVLVQSKFGTLKNVELKFHTGSQRLVADQAVLSIPEIRENATEEIIVNLRQTDASRIKAGDRWFAVYYSYQLTINLCGSM